MRQTACVRCNMDIEGSFRLGWNDRGGNNRCPERHYDEDGMLVVDEKPPKHKPYPMLMRYK